jgi:class 3 adenylate cyclase/tetratricopeptide (TPR) repeat protein
VPHPMIEAPRFVTIVTSDLKGSTSLGERLDPESLREVLTQYFDEMREVFESHGGVIEKIIGDAIIAVFGLPEAREDDALRAVRAAAQTMRTLAALNDQLDARWGVRLTVRTGIATGELVVREATAGEHILTGPVLPLATAMEQNAPSNEVLIAEGTLGLVAAEVVVEPVADIVPKGATRGVPAHRLVTVTTSADQRPGAEVPGDGAARTGGRAKRETRKTVTIVFSDIRATTLDDQVLPPDLLRDVMARSFEAARRALEAHGGTVEKYIGDAVMAVFGLPVRHQDDGMRAVRSALEMQGALALLADDVATVGVKMHVAIGVNTGEVVAGDASLGQRLVTGDAVNVAARLEQAAPDRGVIIGDLTFRLVRDAVDVEALAPLTLKGKAEPVPAYRLVGLRTGGAAEPRVDRPLVGREPEMRLLMDAFTEAVTGGTCRMATLVGDAGVGKTRLTEEFLGSVSANARIVRGRCLPYGDGITFWPIVEMVRQAAEIGEADSPDVARAKIDVLVRDREVTDRVASAIGLEGTTFQVAELFWGIRRFLEIMAAERPVVVLFDDIHWAEATFLDLLVQLTTTTLGAPVVLLCGSRPELLERHPEWAQGSGERRIILSPLSDADAGRVAEHLLGTIELDETIRARIVAAAEGNPLFIEQVLSMLVENGSLREVDGRLEAAADLSRLAIPPTIQALLAARIDSLDDPRRSVIDAASIIGQVFARAAVESLVDAELRDGMSTHLAALTTKDLIRPNPGEEGTAHRFGHILIRDTTYQGLLKRTRAELHERFVAWADEANRASDRASEFEEILGYHLEQAHRYRSELGQLDEHGIDLGIQAALRLASAGDRAFARGDLPAATNLIQRAAALVPLSDPRRPGLLFQLGDARFETGEYTVAIETLRASEEAAIALDAAGLAARAQLKALLIGYLTGTGDLETSPEPTVRESIALFERIGDEPGLADAWRFIANLRLADARYGAATEALEQVIEHARRAGDSLLERRMRPVLAGTALNGPMAAPDVIGLCEALIERSEGDRKTEAQILRFLARAHAMRGDFDLARTEYRRARRDLEELGWTFDAAVTSLDSGPIEMLAGDAAAAEAELRRDYETLDRLGERNYISTVAAVLAEALYRQGRDADAAAFATRSAEIAAPDDVVTQFLWRRVRAKLRAREGAINDAITLANEAVELTGQSDALIEQANALMDLAEVLTAAGSTAEANKARRRAIDLYDQKGDRASAAAARG